MTATDVPASLTPAMRLRRMARRLAPAAARDALGALRGLVAGPAPEDIAVAPYAFAPEEGGLGMRRLNLVLPDLSARAAFGGVTTCLDVMLQLTAALSARAPTALRVIIDAPRPPAADDALLRRPAHFGVDLAAVEVLSPKGPGAAVPMGSGDVTFTFNWWNTVNVLPLLQSQTAHFGGPMRPRCYFVQDYEPGFYAFSGAHMLARHAYDAPGPLWAIFNSTELCDHFAAQGHTAARRFVIDPQLPAGMASRRTALMGRAKRRRVLVYGRASVPRNCFPLLRQGLRAWARRHPGQRDWEVVSAGLPHPPIDLGDGRRVVSLGKLSLEAYAEALAESAVGVSLMASPHPSYPPLEMAHFGLLTLTNRYAGKDLAASHDNIASLEDVMPDTVADALAALCARFEADPGAGWTAMSRRRNYLSQEPPTCLPAIVDAVEELLGDVC